MVEEAAVDEMLGLDVFVAELGGKLFFEKAGELKLVSPEAGEFFEVVVTSIGTGKGEPLFAEDGEVELGGEFEVDESLFFEIAEEEVQLADGVVLVFLDLEILGEEIVAR